MLSHLNDIALIATKIYTWYDSDIIAQDRVKKIQIFIEFELRLKNI